MRVTNRSGPNRAMCGLRRWHRETLVIIPYVPSLVKRGSPPRPVRRTSNPPASRRAWRRGKRGHRARLDIYDARRT